MKLSPASLKQIVRRSNTLWDRFYVPSKLRSDPVYEAVRAELASAALPVLDIGCGLGLLTHYLRETGWHQPVRGIDADQRKIGSATAMAEAAGYDEVSYSVADVRCGLPDHQGHVVLLDMLQFLKQEDHAGLLHSAAERVAPGGKLVIRSGLRDGTRRFKLTVLGDWLAKVTLWMKQMPVAYPTAEELRIALAPLGLEVRIEPLWGGTPFNNHLIVAERPAAG